MTVRKTTLTAIAAIALGVASLPLSSNALAATSTKGLVPLSVQGVGPGGMSVSTTCQFGSTTLDCPGSDSCLCITGTDTLVGNQGFAKGTLGFGMIFDTTAAASILPASTFGDCAAGTGVGLITNSNGKQSLSINISGLACPTATSDVDIFNGTYVVVNGTGKYSSSSGGTGALNGTVDGTTSFSQTAVNGSVMATLPQ